MALLCAGATKAQEIVNTKFDDGPNVATMAQQQATGMQAKSVAVSDGKMENATELAALRAANTTNDDEKTSRREVWIGTFLIWIGAIGVYFSGPAKRFAREMRAMQKKYNAAQEA